MEVTRHSSRTWNSGTCCGSTAGPLHARPDDIHYTMGVRNDLFLRMPNLDPQKLFLTGISNGGSMVFRAGCELSEVFVAMAPVVGSLEMRNRTHCKSSGCNIGAGTDDGYVQCGWDREKLGCRSNDWLNDEGIIYECTIKSAKTPLLMFNGKLDSYTNISGVVYVPTSDSDPVPLYENYCPMSYVWDHFASVYGCDTTKFGISFANGTIGNSTRCSTLEDCATNVTLCISDAGHHWYGDVHVNHTFDMETCEDFFDDPNATDAKVNCMDGFTSLGPYTFSVHVTDQMLDFFEREGLRHKQDAILI